MLNPLLGPRKLAAVLSPCSALTPRLPVGSWLSQTVGELTGTSESGRRV